jgi:hypothetical protein
VRADCALVGHSTEAPASKPREPVPWAPHHASAILMCEEAPIEDPAIRRLCEGIVASQQAEIAQMKALLAR